MIAAPKLRVLLAAGALLALTAWLYRHRAPETPERTPPPARAREP